MIRQTIKRVQETCLGRSPFNLKKGERCIKSDDTWNIKRKRIPIAKKKAGRIIIIKRNVEWKALYEWKRAKGKAASELKTTSKRDRRRINKSGNAARRLTLDKEGKKVERLNELRGKKKENEGGKEELLAVYKIIRNEITKLEVTKRWVKCVA